MEQVEEHLMWYAARIVRNSQVVKRIIERDRVKSYMAPVLQNVIFIFADRHYINALLEKCAGMLFFYRDPERKMPQAIDEEQMRNFILVTSAPDGSIINLGKVDHDFLRGQRVRVTGGVFEGAEGVVKRVLGDRRLIISITGVACIATSFIHPSLLEPVGGIEN